MLLYNSTTGLYSCQRTGPEFVPGAPDGWEGRIGLRDQLPGCEAGAMERTGKGRERGGASGKSIPELSRRVSVCFSVGGARSSTISSSSSGLRRSISNTSSSSVSFSQSRNCYWFIRFKIFSLLSRGGHFQRNRCRELHSIDCISLKKSGLGKQARNQSLPIFS